MSVDPLADAELVEALRTINVRRQRGGLPCPRCMRAPMAQNTAEGWCQPCATEMADRIKASRRRSYHRLKPDSDAADPADEEGEGTPGELPRPAAGYRKVTPPNP